MTTRVYRCNRCGVDLDTDLHIPKRYCEHCGNRQWENTKMLRADETVRLYEEFGHWFTFEGTVEHEVLGHLVDRGLTEDEIAREFETAVKDAKDKQKRG